MINRIDVAQVIERRRDWAKRLWCDEQSNGVTYREVEAKVQSMANKGYDTSHARSLLGQGEEMYRSGHYDELLPIICEVNQALREAPLVAPSSGSPSDLEAIRATWPRIAPTRALDPDIYLDRVLGGWLGKNIGGSLGGMLEGWTRERIMAEHGYVDDYLEKPPSTFNDDIAYEIVMLHALEVYGVGLSSAQLGREWVGHLPQEYCYVAAKVAWGNLMRGVVPPESGTLDNPFSEWVGAQMKGEICGLIAPGRPDIAATYAYIDGIVAHEREGVYGELFVAAATSLAFVMRDVPVLIEEALRYVPPRSKYASIVRQAMRWCLECPDWEEACRRLEASYAQEYHWVHVLPNAAAVVIGLMFGGGDIGRTISIATSSGLDVDCNAGVAGAIIGTMVGAAGIPERLRAPIGESIDTWVVGFEQVPLMELARRTCAVGAKVASERR